MSRQLILLLPQSCLSRARTRCRMKVILVVTLCLAAAEAATCPTLSVVQDFDVSKFAGTWYNQGAMIGNYLTQGYGTCVKAVYTLNSTSGVLAVKNSQKSLLGNTKTIAGTAVLADSSKTEAKMNVTLKTPIGYQTAGLSCLSTDYDNYAIMFACYEKFGVVMKNGWVMTRTQALKDEEKTTVEALIKKALLTINAEGGPAYDDFHTISQTNC